MNIVRFFQLHKTNHHREEQSMKQDDAKQMLRLFLGRTYFGIPSCRKMELVELLEHLPPSATLHDFEQWLHFLRAGAEERARAHQRIAEFWSCVVGCLNKRGRHYMDMKLDECIQTARERGYTEFERSLMRANVLNDFDLLADGPVM
jgi:hypothetical protein